MKPIKNIPDLELAKQKLKYKEKLIEKDFVGFSSKIMDNLSMGLKDWAFSFGSRLFFDFISLRKNSKIKKEGN